MTVLENLMVAQHNPLMVASNWTFGGLLALAGFRRSERAAVEKAKYWLEKTRLIDRADDPPAISPNGDQRRLEIARAMCTDPVLLLCLDEPAAGLNPKESLELNTLLQSIRTDHGTSAAAHRTRHERGDADFRPLCGARLTAPRSPMALPMT